MAESERARARIVLCRPKSPGNMGGVARAMMTMGLSDLILVRPVRPPDHPEALDRACAGAEILKRARVVERIEEAVADSVWVVGLSARPRAAGPPPMDVRDAAAETLRRAASGRVAWVFGSERDGLSNEELLACQARVRIPTGDMLSSLNLAAAVQVACYELHRAAADTRLDEPSAAALGAASREAASREAASRGAVQSVADRLHRALLAVGRYSESDGRTVAAERRFLRALDRLAPSDEEVRAMHAMLKWLGH